MSVLDEIIEGVREDLALRKVSLSHLRDEIEEARAPIDPVGKLKGEGVSVIAEVKRSSPSKGTLAAIADPARLARIYEENGAAVVSVLTEKRRFGGTIEDLKAVRAAVSLPILRKDFMVDEYQFYESRAIGADLILLIVAALSKRQLKDFYDLTRGLGMQALVEVHTNQELEIAMSIDPEIVGVNSRNLKTLEVDAGVFSQIIPQISENVVRVAESGINSRADVEFAESCGADAVLVGEALVRGSDPGAALRALKGQG